MGEEEEEEEEEKEDAADEDKEDEDREGNTAVAAVTPRKEEDDSKDSKDDDEIEEIEDDIQDPEENPAIKIDMNEIEKNMDKWKKKVKDITESEDINIFRYHSRFAKALSTTDIAEHTDKIVTADRKAVSGDDTDMS